MGTVHDGVPDGAKRREQKRKPFTSIIRLKLNRACFISCLGCDLSRSFENVISKVAIIITKSAAIAFFSCTPFLLLALSFSPFIFLRYCDFLAYRA